MPNKDFKEYFNEIVEINKFRRERVHILSFVSDEERIDIKNKVKAPFTFDRTALETIIYGRLLLKGYKLEDITNPNSTDGFMEDYIKEKDIFLDELPKDINNEEEQNIFNEYTAKALIRLENEGTEYIERTIQKYGAFTNCPLEVKKRLVLASKLSFDADQEKDNVKKAARNEIIELKHKNEVIDENRNILGEFSGKNLSVQYTLDAYDKINKRLIDFFDKGNLSAENKASENASIFFGFVLPNYIAQKFVDKKIEKAINNGKKIQDEGNQQFFNDRMPNVSIVCADVDFEVKNKLARIMLEPKLRDTFLGEFINREPKDVFTLKDGDLDINPILNLTEKIFDSNEKIKSFLTKNILNKYLKEDDPRINELKTDDDILEFVMDSHIISKSQNQYYGNELNLHTDENNLEITREQKINDFVAEITADYIAGKKSFVRLPDKNGIDKYYAIKMDDNGIVISDKPINIWEKSQFDERIFLIEKLKRTLDKNGGTLRDSKQYKDLKKAVDESVKLLKSSDDVVKKNEILADLADKADKYYIAKIDEPQNERRNVRFEIASVLRNVDKPDFNIRVDYRQNLMDKIAVGYAKTMLTNGDEKTKAQAKSVIDPYNRENLAKLSNSLSNARPFKEIIEGKNNGELKKMFLDFSTVISDAKNILEKNKKPEQIIEKGL